MLNCKQICWTLIEFIRYFYVESEEDHFSMTFLNIHSLESESNVMDFCMKQLIYEIKKFKNTLEEDLEVFLSVNIAARK